MDILHICSCHYGKLMAVLIFSCVILFYYEISNILHFMLLWFSRVFFFLQMSSSLAFGICRVVLETGISEDENVDNCDKLGKVFNLFSLAVAFEFHKLLGCR